MTDLSADKIHMIEFAKFVQFALPLTPVPLSACFVNVARNGRADSKRYALWKTQTDVALRGKRGLCGKPGKPTIPGEVAVTFSVQRQSNRRQDIDNLLKACGDTLTRNHIIQDDSMIVDLRIKWAPKNSFDGAVLVEIFQNT